MDALMPLFPLNLIAFPGEDLNLHIFEPRYKQLIKDCLDQHMNFAIPSFVNKRIEYGTEMKIINVKKVYDDGRLDITAKGIKIIKVTRLINPIPEKLYAGGEIEKIKNNNDIKEEIKLEMIDLLKELYQSLNIVEDVQVSMDIHSYDIAHKVGFSVEQEYELLKIARENERQVFIIEHLKKAIPILRNVENIKEKIKMNGHFKHYDPLDF